MLQCKKKDRDRVQTDKTEQHGTTTMTKSGKYTQIYFIVIYSHACCPEESQKEALWTAAHQC